MLKQPAQRTVEFDRRTMIDGKVAEVGEVRTFGTGFAAELVSARKAHFVDPAPAPVVTPQPDPTELPEDHPHAIEANAPAHKPRKEK
jgi:hypothetical protein